MLEFLKVLVNNLRGGPVTEPFPFGDTAPTAERLRGKVKIDPKLCMGCKTCAHVCVAGAINFTEHADGSGFDITVWRNTCCLCGQCAYYCPTKAITLVNDWHTAHPNTEKYRFVEHASIKYDTCAVCGKTMRVLPDAILQKIYAGHPEVDVAKIAHLCPECRRIEAAKANRAAIPAAPEPVQIEQPKAATPEPVKTEPAAPAAEDSAKHASAEMTQSAQPAQAESAPMKEEQATLVDSVKPEFTVPEHAAQSDRSGGEEKGKKRNNKRSKRSE